MEYCEPGLIPLPLLNQVTLRAVSEHVPLHVSRTVQVKVTSLVLPTVGGVVLLMLSDTSITVGSVEKKVLSIKIIKYKMYSHVYMYIH